MTQNEIYKRRDSKALKLYVIADRSWLKEDETLLSVCEKVIQNGATFLQLREKN